MLGSKGGVFKLYKKVVFGLIICLNMGSVCCCICVRDKFGFIFYKFKVYWIGKLLICWGIYWMRRFWVFVVFIVL